MKRKFLKSILIIVLLLTLFPACFLTRNNNKSNTGGKHILEVTPLKEIYADYFLIGNIVNPSNIPGNSNHSVREYTHYEALKRHYNVLTFENDMKPDHLWGPGNVYNRPAVPTNRLNQVSGWIKILQNDGFEIVGHTLAWHGQSPNWLNLSAGHREGGPNDPQRRSAPVYRPYREAHQNLKDFIEVVAGHFYKDPAVSIYSWDVLNEVISPKSNIPRDEANWGHHATGAIWSPNNPWQSPWYMCYGTDAPPGVNPWDYVYDAFYYARQSDPSTILMYNDYNMCTPNKVDVVISMVNALNKKYKANTGDNRNLIETIGLQTHIGIDHNLQQLENAIVRYYTETGLNVSITELDVEIRGMHQPVMGPNNTPGPLTERGEFVQARFYAQLFQMFKRHHEKIDRVSWWGLHDGRHWLAKNTYPHLFTSDFMAKEAYFAVADPDGWLEVNDNRSN